MPAKKTSKKAIDYDPLAWLDDSSSSNKEDAARHANRAIAAEQPRAAAKPGKRGNKGGNVETKLTKNQRDSDPLPELTDTVAKASSADEKPASSEEEGYGFFDQPAMEAMTSDSNRDEDSNAINLGFELGIQSVAACKQLLEDSLASGFDVKINTAELQKIDTAGIQLLLSLKQTLRKRGQDIVWEGTSSVIDNTLAALGLANLVVTDSDGAAYGFFNEDSKDEAEARGDDAEVFGFF